MAKLTDCLDVSTPSASTNRRYTKDTGAACRVRASADLLKSSVAITANQQILLQRSAESWTMRAAMLERMEKSVEKRRVIDEAHRSYEIQHARS